MIEQENIQILLIEDNPGDVRLIEEYLKESILQFQPTLKVAQSLEAGIESLQSCSYDIILLDLSLPDSVGLTTLKQVHKVAETTPIIVLTGVEDENIGIETVQLGAQDFLLKNELNATLLGRSVLYAVERNRLNQKLLKSKERFQQAQELAKVGSYELNLETGEIQWSDQTFRIFEIDPEKGAPEYEQLKKIVDSEYHDRMDKTVKKVQQKGKRQYLEIMITTQSGQSKYLHSILDPIKNNEGEVVKIFGTTHDITYRKKFEKKLREKERLYRMLFQAATDEIIVYQLDDDGVALPFLEVNDVACDILGYTREELTQMTVYDIIDADEEEVTRRINYVVEHGFTVHQSQHLTKQGERIPLEISARSFKYDGQQTIISIGRDVRERRKLEQEILNISEQERQRIGRDMHDDLGQMLTGIGLVAQNLAFKLEEKNVDEAGQLFEIVEMVKEADQRARSLARGLATVNVECNGLDAALQELIQTSVKMYDVDIRYFGGEVDGRILNENSARVHLYRIAQEAINNAIKHGDANNIKVGLSINTEYLSLYVEDDGSGFSEPDEVSNGMGVRIMKFRAQMIGGNLEIISEKEQGTEIICHVPLADTP